jgi:hypothetical protein
MVSYFVILSASEVEGALTNLAARLLLSKLWFPNFVWEPLPSVETLFRLRLA